MNTFFANGSRWLRADFHLHTKVDKEFKYSQNKKEIDDGYKIDESFATDYIKALKSAKISVGVITNHNKFNYIEYQYLSKRAKTEDVLLLPGVELSVNEGANGIHLLIVFSEKWIENQNDRINTFIASVFSGRAASEYENENAKCNENLFNVIKTLDDAHCDYFLIFAHVEESKGLWQERKNLCDWTENSYKSIKSRTLGFQKVRTRDKRKQVQQWLGKSYPAEVEGSDCKSIDEIGTKKGETWIKIGAFSFEAVKTALVDKESRCRSEPFDRYKHSYIKSISFDGGIFNGQTVNFSPELNTLIGIRGSGKSSVLEVLRYTLEMSLGPNVSDYDYKQNLVNHALKSGGKAIVTAIDEFGQEYSISRTLGSAPDIVVDGERRPGISIQETILKNPLFFGQKELAADSENYSEELAARLVGNKTDSVLKQIALQKQKISAIIFSLKNDESNVEKISENKKRLENARYNLEKFTKAGVEQKLQEQTDFDDDERKLKQIVDSVLNAKACISKGFSDAKEILNSISSYESKRNSEVFANVYAELNAAKENVVSLQNVFAEFESHCNYIERQYANFSKLKSDFAEKFAQTRRELEAELAKDGKDALNVDELPRLKADIAATEILLSELERKQGELSSKQNNLMAALQELSDLYREEYKIKKDCLEEICSDNEAISIDVNFEGEKETFLTFMKGIFRGSGIHESQYRELAENFSDFISIYSQQDEVKAILGDYSAQFYKTFNNSKNLETLLTYRVPDKITIKYRGVELKKHSLGQRASALMVFILCSKNRDVIIIDQPEDDLDNQTIYNDVISIVKKIKVEEQFIFATHNPNFPVLGDAEQVLSFEMKDKKAEILQGSIDDKKLQKQIIDVMEGGKEAFERRKEIYSTWTSQK